MWPARLGWINLWLGQLDEADEAVAKSLAIDPNYAEGLHVKSKIDVAREDFEAAIAGHEKASSIDQLWSHALAHTYALSGNQAKAREVLESLEDNPWNTYGRVKVYLALDEKEKALEWFQQAYNQRHPYLPWSRRNYDLREIWDTPEFRRLYQTLGIE